MNLLLDKKAVHETLSVHQEYDSDIKNQRPELYLHLSLSANTNGGRIHL